MNENVFMGGLLFICLIIICAAMRHDQLNYRKIAEWKMQNLHPSRETIGTSVYPFAFELRDDGSVWMVYEEYGKREHDDPIKRVMIVRREQ